jgi:transcriptional regulator with XRE-family HTH domain
MMQKVSRTALLQSVMAHKTYAPPVYFIGAKCFANLLVSAEGLAEGTMVRRRPDSVDVAVGERIKHHRLAAGLSQTLLAKAIGVTFQQVQKYERGANRVGAGRLSRIARALEVPVVNLYLGDDPTPKAAPNIANALFAMLRKPDALRLLQAYARMDDAGLRLNILQMVERAAAKSGAYEQPKTRRHRKRRT